jgi:pimeloyl-ACP methyl ester carboxylesterase
MAPSPTVVLVHGAFADASGFAGVIRELQSNDVEVRAPWNPLRARPVHPHLVVPRGILRRSTGRLPSWYMVSEEDNAIPPDCERFMATRAGATVESVSGGSHTAFIARPDIAAGLILKALAG